MDGYGSPQKGVYVFFVLVGAWVFVCAGVWEWIGGGVTRVGLAHIFCVYAHERL